MAKKVLTRKRGNWWSYRFEGAPVDGKRQWITQSQFKTDEEAYAAGIKAYNEYHNSGLIFTPKALSVSDFLEYWLKEYCEINLKETSVLGYRKRIKNIINPVLGKYSMSNVTTPVLQKFLNGIFNKGYSRNTLLSVKGILTKSFKFAKLQGLILSNPALEIDLPRSTAKPKNPEQRKPHIYISKDEMKMIFERFPVGHPSYIPLLLGYRCGMRLGEVFGLQWDDVNFNASEITIQHQMQYDEKTNELYIAPPKYGSVRTISVDSNTLEILKKEYRKQQGIELAYEDQYVHYQINDNGRVVTSEVPGIHFVNVRSDGTLIKPRTMQNVSSVIHNKLNMPGFDFHSLRHTHCSDLLSAGVMPKTVQERLGHKDIATTLNIYQHMTEDLKKAEKETIDHIYE